MKKIRFWLDGCDIHFIAEAPEDITLKQLLKQCDRIEPYWCACGVRSLDKDDEKFETEILIDYNDIKKVDETAECKIKI